MKREIEYHEVSVRFIVRADEAKRAIAGYPGVRDLAQLVAAGIGGNDMNAMDVEELTVIVDGVQSA